MQIHCMDVLQSSSYAFLIINGMDISLHCMSVSMGSIILFLNMVGGTFDVEGFSQ
jgi:hypothetical protein